MKRSDKTPPRKRQWLLRLALALGAPVLAIAILEGLLRLVGYGYDPSFLVQDREDGRYVHENYQFAWRFFPQALARTPQPIRVLEKKPAETIRVIVFGGSAAMGDPQPAFGLARQLECLLTNRYADRKFEVINAAMTAINSHVVLPIAKDCRRLDADVWVVYMGNNEVPGPFGGGTVFGAQAPPLTVIRSGLAFKRTRLGQWMTSILSRKGNHVPENWGGMEMFLNQQVPHTSPKLQTVYENFESNVRDLLAVADQAGVSLILSTVAVNLKDSPPFASGATSDAAVNAEAQFQLGREKLARRASPETHFHQARDLDTLRFRADSKLNEIVRKLDGEVHVVDAEQHFAELSDHGVPGDEWFHEHVHFNFQGNYQLSRLIAEAVATVTALDLTNGEWFTEDACAAWLGHTLFHQKMGLEETQRRLQVPPFAGQTGAADRAKALASRIASLNKRMTPQEGMAAAQSFEEAIVDRPQDWYLRQQYAFLLASANQHEKALEQWQAVVKVIPHDPASVYELGSAYNRMKQRQKAEETLRQAIALRERHPKAWNSLGICLSHQNDFTGSYDAFAQAVAYDPGYAEAYVNWGLVLANRGNHDLAQAKYRSALKANPHYYPAYQHLGESLNKANAFEEAAEVYGKLVEHLPNSANARINLAFARMKLGDHEAAITLLQEAIQLEPNNTTARKYLEQLRARR